MSWAVSAERAEVQLWAAVRQNAVPHGGKGAVPTHRAELSVLRAQQKPAGSYGKGLFRTLLSGKPLVQT